MNTLTLLQVGNCRLTAFCGLGRKCMQSCVSDSLVVFVWFCYLGFTLVMLLTRIGVLST